MSLPRQLSVQPGLVVYTIGYEGNPAQSVLAWPKAGGVFGEFPIRRDLGMYTRWLLFVLHRLLWCTRARFLTSWRASSLRVSTCSSWNTLRTWWACIMVMAAKLEGRTERSCSVSSTHRMGDRRFSGAQSRLSSTSLHMCSFRFTPLILVMACSCPWTSERNAPGTPAGLECARLCPWMPSPSTPGASRRCRTMSFILRCWRTGITKRVVWTRVRSWVNSCPCTYFSDM